MSEQFGKSEPKYCRQNFALAVGMAAGFAFLLGIGAAMGKLAGNEMVLLGCGITVMSSVFLLLNKR